jgi:hypothetical protein
MSKKWNKDYPGPLARIECPADNPWGGRCGECPLVVVEEKEEWVRDCGRDQIDETLGDMVAEEKQACDDKV